MSAPAETIPAIHKALVQEGKDIVIKEAPIPDVGENEILVKVRAIGINPIDVKTYQYFPTEGAYIGCDFTGEVVKLGPNLKADIKVGDKVSATVSGNNVGRGAFAHYAKAFSDIVWKIPEGTLSFEEAAATASPLNTAFQALFGTKELGLTQHLDSAPPKGTENRWVFIYGGSTGLGQFGIQLLKLSGYKVVTVASPRNHELLKGLGADAVFDYKDPDMIKKVKDVAGNSISHVFDAISTKDTQLASVKVLAEDKPGKIALVLPLAEGIQDIRKDVQLAVMNILCSYGHGWDLDLGWGIVGPDDDSRNLLAAFLQKVPELFKDGKLKHIPVNKFGGGLEKVVSDGFEYVASGKVSAEKVVYTI